MCIYIYIYIYTYIYIYIYVYVYAYVIYIYIYIYTHSVGIDFPETIAAFVCVHLYVLQHTWATIAAYRLERYPIASMTSSTLALHYYDACVSCGERTCPDQIPTGFVQWHVMLAPVIAHSSHT